MKRVGHAEIMRRKNILDAALRDVFDNDTLSTWPEVYKKFCTMLGYPNSTDPYTLVPSMTDEALRVLERLEGPHAYTLFKVWEAQNE